MYLKVAQITLISLLLTACSNQMSPTPKQQTTNNLGVEVVEEIENRQSVQKMVPVRVAPSVSEPKKVKIKKSKTKKNSTKKHYNNKKKKIKKHSLKPEPFSIERNEDDPELLGPQTTLKTPLSKKSNNNNTKSI